MSPSGRGAIIGIDTGGTFTDAVLILPSGEVRAAKVHSTPDDFAVGVLGAVDGLAAAAGLEAGALLAGAARFVHGTTVTTNSVLSRRGARCGLLTTAGFEDTLLIGRVRQKTAGRGQADLTHAVRLTKPEPLVPRQLIYGIPERVDAQGRICLPLDEAAVRRAAEELGRAGVESVAICFLWSFLNPAHERRARDLVQGLLPGAYITASVDLVPRFGEYERLATTALNAYLGPIARRYLERLEERLRQRGLTVPLQLMRTTGGIGPVSQVLERPVETVHSGPVGGLAATRFWAERTGEPNLIASDVGGTSFEVGLVVDGQPLMAPEPVVGGYHTFVPMRDLASIGTGGGSLAWVEPATGVLRVGPASAGADPGPACYGRGGREPTLTDASLVLGYLNPEGMLGGALRLDAELAAAAIEARVARPLGLGVQEAAWAIYRIATEHMADLLRRVTVHRGVDARDFALIAYGGAGPQYVAAYAAELPVRDILVPHLAPVFSAFGAAVADAVTTVSRSCPTLLPADPAPLAAAMDELLAEAAGAARAFGLAPERVSVKPFVEMRLRHQVHEVRVDWEGGLGSPADLETLVERFLAAYEAQYGTGTSYRAAGVEVTTLGVEVIGLTDRPALPQAPPGDGDPSQALSGRRPAWFEGGPRPTARYVWERLEAGDTLAGPACVEAAATVVLVPPGWRASLDGDRSIHLARDGGVA